MIERFQLPPGKMLDLLGNDGGLVKLHIDDSIKFPIYRFTQKIYVNQFLETGKIRLNALWNYHDEERHLSAVGDRQEGNRHFISDSDVGFEDDLITSFVGNSINQWTICLIKYFSDDFYELFNSNCCMIINSIDFFIELAKQCSSKSAAGLLTSILYIDNIDIAQQLQDAKRQNLHYEPPFLAATKSRNFSYQSEIGFIMEPFAHPDYWKTFDRTDNERRNIANKTVFELRNGKDPQEYLKLEALHPNLEPLLINAPEARKHVSVVYREN